MPSLGLKIPGGRGNNQDMTLADIKSMRDRAPFRAFQLHLTNGETLSVRHPEYVSLPPEPGTELFVVWVGVHWNLVDATQVARVSFLVPEKKKPTGKKVLRE